MSSEWRRIKLRDFGRIVTGKTPATSRADYFGGLVPFLTPTDMHDGLKFVGTERTLTEVGLATVKNSLIPKGVAVSCIGWKMGKSVLVTSPTVTNQQINTVVVDEARFDLSFVYYLLSSIRAQIFELGATPTRTPIVNKSTFGNIDILVPGLPLQREIAQLGTALDDRITLLRETNATLEAIAQALFKSWFVDFDPVRAKMEGRIPEGMDEDTARLFPDGLEESELGLVPRGWRVANVGTIANVIDCLHSKKPELFDSGRPFLQLNNIRNDGLLDTSEVSGISNEEYKKWISRIEVTTGDCVITNVGRVGAVAQIPNDFKAAMGRNMTAIRLMSNWPYPTYLIELLQSKWMRSEIEKKTDTGTILNALNVKNIPLLQCVLSPGDVLQAFENVSRSLRAGMEENIKRVHSLATLRDTLLPRLISGQLRLPEAEAHLEEVTT